MKHQKYRLEKNANGTVTQVRNADGNSNIFQQRPQLRKLNEEALNRPTAGKLGNLSDTQMFNFSFKDTNWPTSIAVLRKVYNTSVTTQNATFCVMFGTDSLNQEKALYYNITDIKVNCFSSTDNKIALSADSYIEFYLLENIETSTTSLGRKIPRRAPLFGADSSATFSFITGGAQQGYQYISSSLSGDSNPVTSVSGKGFRSSGIALKTIFANATGVENWNNVVFNVMVTVDISSVSSTY